MRMWNLGILYEDPNRVINAKDKLHDLKRKPSDQFQSFLSDFTYLAVEAGLAKQEWKEELYRKLYTHPQSTTIDLSEKLKR